MKVLENSGYHGKMKIRGILPSKPKTIYIPLASGVEKITIPEEITTTFDLEDEPSWEKSGLLDKETAGKLREGKVDMTKAESIIEYVREVASWHVIRYMLENGKNIFDFRDEKMHLLWSIARKARILKANLKIGAVDERDILSLISTAEKIGLKVI